MKEIYELLSEIINSEDRKDRSIKAVKLASLIATEHLRISQVYIEAIASGARVKIDKDDGKNHHAM